MNANQPFKAPQGFTEPAAFKISRCFWSLQQPLIQSSAEKYPFQGIVKSGAYNELCKQKRYSDVCKRQKTACGNTDSLSGKNKKR